ncbi:MULTISPECIES: fluoride efflux transporter CrcB [Saccharopolyspora]|uniref:Fluoride-specific ion channel FluC n=1 Tax=Saccharopolyspora gregorii TaxID=33914 RepID=A0ABP6S1E3_9PSEU|nr:MULTISPECIES: fluoride efflux transporter CrcB [unclassified Saccharopolyspora]MCA1189006.1 fluoride efflux transporter CrcB [Saccharopolyspora sp. 6T]MCA1191208.1 fluoride efflux transporter CrcB [Saccharopolyspora sp. 6V]MCA1228903.1 fluoride efflux transporter CrcB [Saccharopolyspora sp. 6M]MCA1281912.1 fluoride efflux transporter CrcB [Saccharopolyspora sp. 7B]
MANPDEAVDPDVDSRIPAQRRELSRTRGAVLLVIALGGGLGALARYGISLLLPTEPGRFPWATFGINVLGCLLIGVLMVLITEVWTAHPLVRPFFGVGVLGGFTTFSTYAVEFSALLAPGTVLIAAAYLAGTLLCALLAVLLGVALTRWAVTREVG